MHKVHHLVIQLLELGGNLGVVQRQAQGVGRLARRRVSVRAQAVGCTKLRELKQKLGVADAVQVDHLAAHRVLADRREGDIGSGKVGDATDSEGSHDTCSTFHTSLCFKSVQPRIDSRFFCVSLLMDFFRRKPTPAPVTNGTKRQFSKEELNKATVNLQSALNKIANQHVLKYANAIRVNAKANANAARANAVAAVSPTQTNIKSAINANKHAAVAKQNMIETEKEANAAVNAAPASEPVPAATLQAENAAVNAVARNAAALANFNARIAATNNTTALSKIESNILNYASKHSIPYVRNNVKKRLNAVNTKRNSIRAAPQN